MRDLQKLLTPDDKEFLQQSSNNSWIPKEPREVLLPYAPKETQTEEEKNIENRRKEAQKVYDGYTDIIKICKELEASIEDRCKNVKASLNRSQNKSVMEAMARVFGQGLQEEISFEQYKACIKALGDLNSDLPKPGDKE